MFVVHGLAKSEISNFNHTIVEDQILRFEVVMDDGLTLLLIPDLRHVFEA